MCKPFCCYLPYASRILPCNQNLPSINGDAKMCYVVRPDDVNDITRLWIIYVHGAISRCNQQKALWEGKSHHWVTILSKYIWTCLLLDIPYADRTILCSRDDLFTTCCQPTDIRQWIILREFGDTPHRYQIVLHKSCFPGVPRSAEAAFGEKENQ